MAQPMPPIDDDNYVSSEDDDFLPDAPAAEAASESEESEDEAETSIPEAKAAAKPKPKPKKGQDEEAEEIGFENSGDEAIIGKGLKKARKRKRRGKDEEDDDEGGEGGFVKTRRMRAEMAYVFLSYPILF